MKWPCVVLTGIWLALAVPAHGEFYKYRDENGVMRFTDNLVEVPVDQRPGVGRYKEADDDLTPEDREKRAQARAAAEESRKAGAEKAREQAAEAAVAAEDAGTIETAEELNRRNNELFEAYQALDRERQELKKQGANIRTRAASNVYNQKVKALNKRFEAYKKRQAAFQTQVEAFNQKQQAQSAPAEEKEN